MMKRQTLIILTLLCMVSLFAAAASANDIEDATIGIGDGSGYVTIPITVTNATNAGTVDVTLEYDPTIVNVTNVAKGDMGSIFSNLKNATDGWVRIGAFKTGDGLNGAFILANVSFEPVGSSGSCPLEISVNEYVEASPIYNAMPYTVSNGTYTLISEESDDGDDIRDDSRDDDRYAWYLYEDHDSGKNVTEEVSSGNATPVETPTAPPLKNLPGEDELHDEDNDDEDKNSLWWIVITIVCLIIVAAVTRSKMRSRNDDDSNERADD